MFTSLPSAVIEALPAPMAGQEVALDVTDLQHDLDVVACDVADAIDRGLNLAEAVRSPDFPRLVAFHQALRDALLVEIPDELGPLLATHAHAPSGAPAENTPLIDLQRIFVSHAQAAPGEHPSQRLHAALAEFLLFQAVRLRLLITAWSSDDFESLGGEEQDIDDIACEEVAEMLTHPSLAEPGVRPLVVMLAGASLSLSQDVHQRAEALRLVGDEEREHMRMRARLRSALRELRLAESVLLENALASLLGNERLELGDLQAARPLALEGMSRQAMDQRVSRGRKALTRSREHWPARRKPALFDLLRPEVRPG
jgi:hypothetical protein